MDSTLSKRKKYSFPNDIKRGDFDVNFVWGTATSAYQIEGAALEGGRKASVWDTFCQIPGAIVKGHNGEKGIDTYNRTKEDVQLMKKLGLNAYRFSLSWSRILPGGKLSKGINQEGVDYYNNLINELKKNDIEPYVTLWHWDTPHDLEEAYGGFLNEQIIYDFADYAEFCFWEFGDRVKHWITLNEPHNYAESGYALGFHAPGRGGSQPLPGGFKRPFDNKGLGNAATEPYIVTHNLLLSHATAAQRYHQGFKDHQKGKIGITLDTQYNEPLDKENLKDVKAAKRAMDFIFGWFMEPLRSGEYPKFMIKYVKNIKDGGRLPEFSDEQKELLKKSYDFIGLNYYTARYATKAKETDDMIISYLTDSKVDRREESMVMGDDRKLKLIGPKGGVYWFYTYPEGLKQCLLLLKKDYGDPLVYITENGYPDANDNDMTTEEARADIERVHCYHDHLVKVKEAISEGCNVQGYFAWSMMDNFEWDQGYDVRFGLYYVDYSDGKYTRYPKYSAVWFSKFLNSTNSA